MTGDGIGVGVKTAIELFRTRQIEVPAETVRQADRLGALIYGLLRSDKRTDTD